MLSRTLPLAATAGIVVAAISTAALANPPTPIAKKESFVHLVGDYDGPRHERGYRRGWDADGPRWGVVDGATDGGVAAVALFATNALTALVGGLGASTAAWIIEAVSSPGNC